MGKSGHGADAPKEWKKGKYGTATNEYLKIAKEVQVWIKNDINREGS